MKLLRIILGILLPPLGVFLTTGISTAFLINIMLTVLGWIPGSIHAVWVITKYGEQTAEGTY
ncbi:MULTISPECIES: YqaE/Pmp3 family membrane protein [unclassified Coleofasciculus]|uniref:YqaE/Pmp3 family membrane protein n=1 Tax=unclassified Coleofasciculus TaxID=2692782 RepID=UPI00187F3C89|nr:MULTISPECIES: YqaE/Pmp3 family membrane protein [unclassified Coleofasciculus]MBE9124789.1 YqaE/Pmp3 family membrane protein [Coleofasciculus sp. LEGE 07081]MBE9147693.1 YqaE/Pmp3 family membrane protein [Coleofasciculus sp. LEGE 07092]